jgi:hypothetical protein
LALGAYVVALWAYFSFHSPHRISEIAYAVRRPRYLLAVNAYMAAMMHAYILMVSLCYLLYFVLASKLLNLGYPSALAVAAALAALSVTWLFPSLPYVRGIIHLLRQAAHEFALYPFARNSLTSILERSDFTIEKDATPALLRELGSYGVAPETRELILPSAWEYLEELYSLVTRLRKLGREQTLAGFFEARREQFEHIDWGLARLIRRTARALQYGQAIDKAAAQDEQRNERRKKLTVAISTFVTEESDELLKRCHKLLSEAALSSESEVSKQEQLLARVGYDVVLPKQLPTTALLMVGAIFPLELLIFLTAYELGMFPKDRWDWTRIVALGLVRAICQTAAAGWAIFPKVLFSWARPSLYGWPRKSYVIFGLASLAFSVLVFFLLWQTFPRPAGPRAAVPLAVVNALSFLVMTIVLSFRIDRRLQAPTYDYDNGRWQDAAVLGGWIALVTALFFILLPKIAGQSPRDPIAMAIFVVVLGLEAGLIGYFVPATAAAHLEARVVQALEGAKAESVWIEEQRSNESRWPSRAKVEGIEASLVDDRAEARRDATGTAA